MYGWGVVRARVGVSCSVRCNDGIHVSGGMAVRDLHNLNSLKMKPESEYREHEVTQTQ